MWAYFVGFLALAAIVGAIVAVGFLRRYLGRALTQLRAFRTSQHNATVSINALAFYQKPAVKHHLAALDRVAGSQAPEKVELSYGLSRVVDRISPTFHQSAATNTVVCTVAIGDQFRSRVQRCLDSQSDFAGRNGFAYCRLDQPPEYMGRPAAWMKVPLIVKLMQEGYKRILFIDADAMVTNRDFSIDSLFARLERTPRPILLTEDEDGINTGVMFVQNTDAALRLLDLIWLNDTDINNGTWEQNSLKFLMDASNGVKSSVLIEPDPKRINSFPVERRLFHATRAGQIWSAGDFICHFSGIRPPHLERYIFDYSRALRRSAAETTVVKELKVAVRG